jgi:type IV secretory pathway TraG/TraD family ATPase VirD4
LVDVTLDRGLYLGRANHHDVSSGAQRSTLVLGPSRSGKTTSLIIPNLLMTSRSSITTSTKDDVLRAMSGARRDATTLLFDPSGTVDTPPGVRRVGYSPLRQSSTWDGAVLATRSLVDVSRRRHLDEGDSHWSERAGALVAPMLHAAALGDESLAHVATRVDARHADDLMKILVTRYGEGHPSVSLLRGVLATEERERSGIWSTASSLFQGMRTEAARAAAREAPLDIDEFLRGPHQLHIVSPSRYQAVAVPMVVGMIDEVVHATYDRHHDGARLLLALDELANVAPLPRLASVVSEGGGQGVVTLACLQDLSQARSRWGQHADGFLSLFPTTVVLPGIADRNTLEMIHHLAGRTMVPSHNIQHSRRGRAQGYSHTWVERDVTSIGDVARGRDGYALGLTDRKELRWIELTPSYADARFRPYLERSNPSRDRSRER